MLLVFFIEEGAFHPHGTAVVVAPGVALGATHVFAGLGEGLESGAREAWCLGIASNGTQLWNIRAVTMIAGTDISLLGIQLRSSFPEDRVMRKAVISTRTPCVGERLWVTGFRAGADEYSMAKLEISTDLFLASGLVTNVHAERRDSVMMRWPTVEFQATTVGGMSGGPVFDSSGALIGLLCSSWEGSNFSNAGLIWPSLMGEIHYTWPPELYAVPCRLQDLPANLCTIIRPEAVWLTDSGRTAYKPWNA